MHSNVVYKFWCGRWNDTYYDEIYEHLSIRANEHLGVSPLTGKKPKSKKSAAVKDHLLFIFFCGYITSIEDFKFWQPVTQIFMLRQKNVF